MGKFKNESDVADVVIAQMEFEEVATWFVDTTKGTVVLMLFMLVGVLLCVIAEEHHPRHNEIPEDRQPVSAEEFDRERSLNDE